MSDVTNNDSKSAPDKGRRNGFGWIFEECLLPATLAGGAVFAIVHMVLSNNGGGGIV